MWVKYFAIYPILVGWVIYGSIIYFQQKSKNIICSLKHETQQLVTLMFIILIIGYVKIFLMVISLSCKILMSMKKTTEDSPQANEEPRRVSLP